MNYSILLAVFFIVKSQKLQQKQIYIYVHTTYTNQQITTFDVVSYTTGIKKRLLNLVVAKALIKQTFIYTVTKTISCGNIAVSHMFASLSVYYIVCVLYYIRTYMYTFVHTSYGNIAPHI